MEKDQGKVIVGLFLATVFSVLSQASFADVGANQQVLNKVDGQYGANLNNVTGATVQSNGTYADIKNTATNSVLEWNTLNIAPGQTLNYVMNEGQTSLNRVLTPQLSRFAGNLTSTGGRLIISNPMGMIFENGSYTNVNSLTLTTHDAQYIDGKLILDSANKIGNQGIIIGGVGASSNAAVMRVAQDLNLVSNDIKVENADIFAGNANFVTADGVTFVQKDLTITNSNNSNSYALNDSQGNDVGTIYTKNSIIALKDNSTGKIYLASKGEISGVKAEKTAMDGKIELNVDGNADLSVVGNADVTDSNVTGNLNVKTVDDSINLANSGSYYDLTNYEYTLKDQLDREGYTTKSQVKAYLKALAKTPINPTITDIAPDVVDHYYDNAATTICGVLQVSHAYTTNTSYAGNGNVSVSNSVVGGNLNTEGASVAINNVTAYDSVQNAVGTNGSSATVNEKLTKNIEYQRYNFGGELDSSNKLINAGFNYPAPLIKSTTVIVNKHETTGKAAANANGTVDINNLVLTKPVGADTNDRVTYNNDHDKDLYGDEVNARFTRQFTPRGFAASDDEMNARKAKVKSSAQSGNNDSIILNDSFIAD